MPTYLKLLVALVNSTQSVRQALTKEPILNFIPNFMALKSLLEAYIKEAFGMISGSVRKPSTKKQQYKLGYVADENTELSSFQAEIMFPGATDAWAEIVPELFPDYTFSDPQSIKGSSLWFKIGDELRVAFEQAPTIELAKWDPVKEDWIELIDLGEAVLNNFGLPLLEEEVETNEKDEEKLIDKVVKRLTAKPQQDAIPVKTKKASKSSSPGKKPVISEDDY